VVTDLVEGLVSAVVEFTESHTGEATASIRSYEPASELGNQSQFLLMLKPEIVVPPAGNGAKPLTRVLQVLTNWGVAIGAVRVLSTEWVRQHAVVESHYPALNVIAKAGLAGMSPMALRRLDEAYPAFRAANGRVLGAYELLAEVSELTPFALEVLTRNLQVKKLGTGTYSIMLRLDDEDIVVLNPFHPQQVSHFTGLGGAVALLECRSALDLPTIRHAVIGATDPRDALPGSIKGILHREQGSLGLAAMSTRRNGVHVSPSLLEGMATLIRYFSVDGYVVSPGDTVFGRQLAAVGVGAEIIKWALGNPYVKYGEIAGPLFELTEDMNRQAAVALIAESARAGVRSDASGGNR
jgi:nucleoside diphosphate kinase